jgi:HPt (histidine-containing phosphotransfer) domain-containing protein
MTLSRRTALFYMQINRTIALEHVDGDEALLAELAAMFVEDYPRLIGELSNSIENGDHVLVERTAHTLKGRLAFFGMVKQRERALKLEISGRQRELAEAQNVLADLDHGMQIVMPEFRALADVSNRVS